MKLAEDWLLKQPQTAWQQGPHLAANKSSAERISKIASSNLLLPSQFSATKPVHIGIAACIHSLSWMKATCLGTDTWQCVVKAVICLQLLSSTSRSTANKANTTLLPVIRKYFSCFLKMGSNCHYDNATRDTGAIHVWPKTRPLNASMRMASRSLWFQDTCIKDCRES